MECFLSSLLISWLIWLQAFIVRGEAPHLITRLLHDELCLCLVQLAWRQDEL